MWLKNIKNFDSYFKNCKGSNLYSIKHNTVSMKKKKFNKMR